MTKAELIDIISRNQHAIPAKDVELAVNLVIEALTEALVHDHRIEMRGFGAFTTRYRKPRIGRNPNTGTSVQIDAKRAIHFKPGKQLKESLMSH